MLTHKQFEIWVGPGGGGENPKSLNLSFIILHSSAEPQWVAPRNESRLILSSLTYLTRPNDLWDESLGDFIIVRLSVIILSNCMLSVTILNVIRPSVIKLSVIKLLQLKEWGIQLH
jgi:hypothetical protein